MMGVGILITVLLISIIGRHDMRHVALHEEHSGAGRQMSDIPDIAYGATDALHLVVQIQSPP